MTTRSPSKRRLRRVRKFRRPEGGFISTGQKVTIRADAVQPYADLYGVNPHDVFAVAHGETHEDRVVLYLERKGRSWIPVYIDHVFPA